MVYSVSEGELRGLAGGAMRHVIWGLLGIGAGCLVTMSVARSGVGERAGGAALPSAPASIPSAISQGARSAIAPPAARVEADRRTDDDARNPRHGDTRWFRHRDERREDSAEGRGAVPSRDFDGRRWRDIDRPRNFDPPRRRRWTSRERDWDETFWRRGERGDRSRPPREYWGGRPPSSAQPWPRRGRPGRERRPSPFMEPGIYWAGLPSAEGAPDSALPISPTSGASFTRSD